jgi:predicted metal-dependent TIM-barrel fold hydrolase
MIVHGCASPALRTMDALEEHNFDPAPCVIDHHNEKMIREVRDRGYWCFSIYPQTKMAAIAWPC